MDNDESKTALYGKPRRIIHNQTLILVLAILCNFVSFPIAPAIIFYLYKIIPEVFVPVVLIGWGALAAFFISIDCYVVYQKWKEKHGYEDETDFNRKTRQKEEKHARDTISY